VEVASLRRVRSCACAQRLPPHTPNLQRVIAVKLFKMIRAIVEAVGDSSFILSFIVDTQCFRVRRSVESLFDLDKVLAGSYVDWYGSVPPVCLGQLPTASELEHYLNFWLSLYGENIAVFDALNSFMDDATHQIEIFQCQLLFLRGKVGSLQCSSNCLLLLLNCTCFFRS
jgi:hypothetical protein